VPPWLNLVRFGHFVFDVTQIGMSDTILGSFDKRNWRDRADSSIKLARKASSSVVDVAASLMRMWQ